MRRYSEAIKAAVKRRLSPLQLQSVARTSEQLGNHAVITFNWGKAGGYKEK
jgi:hypothetical protein